MVKESTQTQNVNNLNVHPDESNFDQSLDVPVLSSPHKKLFKTKVEQQSKRKPNQKGLCLPKNDVDR